MELVDGGYCIVLCYCLVCRPFSTAHVLRANSDPQVANEAVSCAVREGGLPLLTAAVPIDSLPRFGFLVGERGQIA